MFVYFPMTLRLLGWASIFSFETDVNKLLFPKPKILIYWEPNQPFAPSLKFTSARPHSLLAVMTMHYNQKIK